MKRNARFSFLTCILLSAAALGHETDQFTVPLGQEYANLSPYFAKMFHDHISAAVEKTNRKIRRCNSLGVNRRELSRLQSGPAIAAAVYREFPPVINHIDQLEIALHNPSMQKRFSGFLVAYRPFLWIYSHSLLGLDLTRPVRLFRTSTVMVNDTYFGTDKVAHFVHMGFIYYKEYLRLVRTGQVAQAATEAAARIGAGNHLFLSEAGLLGLLTTGVRSNADLAANYAGLKFFQNLTNEVRIAGELRPPMLVLHDGYWRLNGHVRPQSDFFEVFISDHWDEALNPSEYALGMEGTIRDAVARRCPDIRQWYVDSNGQPRPRKYFDGLVETLSTYFGEDYGHQGSVESLISIGNTCFPAEEEAFPPDSGITALHSAALDGQVDAVAMLLKGGADCNARSALGVTPLHAAVDHPDVAEALIRAGAEVNAKDVAGRTALAWATRSGRADAVELLLRNGAEVNTADVDGQTPLHCAARRGQEQVAAVLLEHGADVDSRAIYDTRPLHAAAQGKSRGVLERLLQRGADVGASDEFGWTALHDSAAQGDEVSATVLLKYGAEVNAIDGYGTTPLHCAARGGHKEVAACLLASGAQVRAVNHLGRTPMEEAKSGNCQAVVDLFRAWSEGRRAHKAVHGRGRTVETAPPARSQLSGQRGGERRR